ncbi:ig-like domain-containing protein [Trichonephila clavipes]|nr:ig-like domain-containing protein [Trichonephila clavipes]
MTSVDDEITLILWHREDSGSPLYSIDARDAALHNARHFPSINVSSRAYFNASGSPTVLRIDGVRKSEEGMYRCRVEYRRSRTETTDILLTVIGNGCHCFPITEIHYEEGTYREHPIRI